MVYSVGATLMLACCIWLLLPHSRKTIPKILIFLNVFMIFNIFFNELSLAISNL